MQIITPSDSPSSDSNIEYLLDLDGTCYDISNEYEDHVRYVWPKAHMRQVEKTFTEFIDSPMRIFLEADCI